MPIARDDDGFLFWDDAWGGPALGLESNRLQICVDQILEREIAGVFGRSPEFYEADLNCLARLSHISSLGLWDVPLRDIGEIYALDKLCFFRLSGKRPHLDFTRLRSVRNLVIDYHRKDAGLAEMHDLRMIDLWRYKAAYPNDFEFHFPQGVEEVGLFWSNIGTLEGFGICPNVRKLNVTRCRSLKSLGSLAFNFPKLEHLVVEACGRLTADEARSALSGHVHIRHAFAGGQRIVSAAS